MHCTTSCGGVPFIPRVVPAVGGEEVLHLHVQTNEFAVKIQRNLRSGLSKELPVFRSLTGEGHPHNLIGGRIALDAPLTVLILYIAAPVSNTPTLQVAYRADEHIPRKGDPGNIYRLRIRAGLDLGWVVELPPGAVKIEEVWTPFDCVFKLIRDPLAPSVLLLVIKVIKK